MKNEDPQIGADNEGEWEETPKLDYLFFAGAFMLFVFGALTWGGFL